MGCATSEKVKAQFAAEAENRKGADLRSGLSLNMISQINETDKLAELVIDSLQGSPGGPPVISEQALTCIIRQAILLTEMLEMLGYSANDMFDALR